MANILSKVGLYFRGLTVTKKVCAIVATVAIIGVGIGFYAGLLPIQWDGRILGYERVYDSLTNDQVIEMVRGCGIEKIEKGDTGAPIFYIGSVPVLVTNRNGNGILGFIGMFRAEEKPTLEVLNKWNSNSVFSKAYLLDEETVIFESDVNLIGGVTKRHVVAQIWAYITSMQKFVLKVYLHGAAPGTPAEGEEIKDYLDGLQKPE